MAANLDKAESSLTTVSDLSYIRGIDSSGNSVKISKSDLASVLGVNIYQNHVITTRPAFSKDVAVLDGITIEDTYNGFSIGIVTWIGAGATVQKGDAFIAYKASATWQSPKKITLT